jgi:hypothetical protein
MSATERDFFRQPPRGQINLKHPLVRLADLISWNRLGVSMSENEKAIARPTDSRLLERCRAHLVKAGAARPETQASGSKHTAGQVLHRRGGPEHELHNRLVQLRARELPLLRRTRAALVTFDRQTPIRARRRAGHSLVIALRLQGLRHLQRVCEPLVLDHRAWSICARRS